MYADVSIIVDGVLEEESTFTDQALMDDYLATIAEEAEGHGYPVEVFVVWHEHDPSDGECVCVQYLTDNKPYATHNVRGG
jgi:hypothetical protein